jgi:arsenate reductase
MKFTFLSIIIIALIGLGCTNTNTKNKETMTNETEIQILDSLKNYVAESVKGFNTIGDERKQDLEKMAEYISAKVASGDSINLTFICTHNSRRSHMSQLWAQTAAYYYNIPGVETYSGGTEATAFNPRAVKAMRKAGFEIEQNDSSDNPNYKVTIATSEEPVTAFSKKFEDEFNPQQNFAAVMTCSSADEACPFVPGADARFAIPYEDPKKADNTPEEEARYDERARQISIEMFYVFSKVKS